jgi:hypothetical protein
MKLSLRNFLQSITLLVLPYPEGPGRLAGLGVKIDNGTQWQLGRSYVNVPNGIRSRIAVDQAIPDTGKKLLPLLL